MKKLYVFGLLIIFLAGFVNAIQLTVTASSQSVSEGSTLLIGVSADVNATFQNNASLTVVSSNSTSVIYRYNPGYRQGNFDWTEAIEFIATEIGSTRMDTGLYPITIIDTNRAVENATARASSTNVGANNSVTLTGSAIDPDGDETLTYTWDQIGNLKTNINFPVSVKQVTFKPEEIGTYQFRLTVSDGQSQITDLVTVTVTEKLFLEIDYIKVKVGSNGWEDIDDQNGTTIDDEVEPGDEIKFKIKLENTHDDEDDEFKDVKADIEIKDWDKGEDDQEEETDEIDIEGEDSETLEELTFEAQWIMKEDGDTYEILIIISGEDDAQNRDIELVYEYELEVKKDENNLLKILQSDISPEQITCKGTATLDLEIVNIGEDDQDDTIITVTNSELELAFEDEVDIDAGADPDDAVYDKKIKINVNDVETGQYRIDINVEYDDGDETESEVKYLNVISCDQEEEEEEEEIEEEEEEEEQNQPVEQDNNQDPVQDTNTGRFPVIAQVEEPDFTESTTYIVLLTAGVIILIGLIVSIIVILIKRK